MKDIIYSIIIPNKNSANLLARCIDSIPAREDIQIIVVDDNSDPSQIDFSSYPGHERSNVEIILTKEGLGAGYARNRGLEKAKGKWVLFADSDDFYNYGAFDELDIYSNSNADIVFFDVTSVDTITYEKSNRDKLYGTYIKKFLNGEDPNAELIRFKKWEPWFKMFKRSFVINSGIKFDQIPRCNDMSFCLEASLLAKSFEAIDKKLYCVTMNQNSITKKKMTKESFWNSMLCEIKKNHIYTIINHKDWHTSYSYILLCVLKNNGIKDFLSFCSLLWMRRSELSLYKQNLKYKFKI